MNKHGVSIEGSYEEANKNAIKGELGQINIIKTRPNKVKNEVKAINKFVGNVKPHQQNHKATVKHQQYIKPVKTHPKNSFK